MRKMGCWWAARWAKFRSRSYTKAPRRPRRSKDIRCRSPYFRRAFFRYSSWVGCTVSWKPWIPRSFYNIHHPLRMGYHKNRSWQPTWWVYFSTFVVFLWMFFSYQLTHFLCSRIVPLPLLQDPSTRLLGNSAWSLHPLQLRR